MAGGEHLGRAHASESNSADRPRIALAAPIVARCASPNLVVGCHDTNVTHPPALSTSAGHLDTYESDSSMMSLPSRLRSGRRIELPRSAGSGIFLRIYNVHNDKSYREAERAKSGPMMRRARS